MQSPLFRRHERVTRIAGLLILARLLLVAVSSADFDGRYLAYVLPLFGLLAACGAVSAAARLRWSGRAARLIPGCR